MSKVIVTTFSAGQESAVRAWRLHAARVVGDVAPAMPNSVIGLSVWQLVSDNHRVLARRITVFNSVGDALTDARSSLDMPELYRPSLVHDRVTRSLGWFLRLGDEPSVVSARWYESERDRRSALALATAGLSAARIVTETRVARTVRPRHSL